MRIYLSLQAVLLLVLPLGLMAQAPTPAQVQQAQAVVNTMTPDQINAKLQQYGITQAQAQALAQQYGIDVPTLLTRYPTLNAPSGQSGIPQTAIYIGGNPASAAPAVDTTAKHDSLLLKQNPPLHLAPMTPYDSLIFGLTFFRSAGNNYQPSPSIADKNYIVGAGDVLKISLWGQVQSSQELEVDDDGTITLASVGPMLVSGYTIDQAKNRIISALSQSFAGLVSKPPSIFLDLSLSKLRPVRVFIMGEVQKPGGYFVNNFANVFNSLFVVGGPKASGSMRDVRVIRNGKVLARVDLYDYLLGTNKTNDVRINDNDIIFVPLRGKRASIDGDVLRPYTYELLPGENLRKLIDFSGGLRSSIYSERVQIDRIVPFDERVKGADDRKLLDIDFSDIAAGRKDYTLENGDAITVFPILERRENYVTVNGEVHRPGKYQFDKLRTIKDLIGAADGLWPTSYLKRAELYRIFPDKKLQLISLDLQKVMANDPEHNLPLQKLDSLRIYSIYEINPRDSITISGHVQLPGKYPYAANMTLRKLLLSIGGLEDSVFRANTFLERGDIFRLNKDLINRRVIQLNIGSILDDAANDVPVMQGDEIRIYGLGEIEFLQKTVQVFGSVKNPGFYRLFKEMTLTDLLLQAGGYTEDAWPVHAEVARISRQPSQKDSLVMINFPELPDLFDTTRSAIEILSSKAGSFRLNNKDEVFVRPNPDYRPQQIVTVTGEVRYPGTYALTVSSERLSDVIKRAGGLTKDGYARGGQLIRDSTRMRLNMMEALNDEGGKYDAILKPGDAIDIPRHINTVTVAGEVNNPGSYAFVDGQSRNFYIDMAGGKTDSAEFALVELPEGYVVRNGFGWFSGNPSIPDGSNITVVKIKPEPPSPPSANGASFYDYWKEALTVLSSTLTIYVLVKHI